jgi:hypothetical protein
MQAPQTIHRAIQRLRENIHVLLKRVLRPKNRHLLKETGNCISFAGPLLLMEFWGQHAAVLDGSSRQKKAATA